MKIKNPPLFVWIQLVGIAGMLAIAWTVFRSIFLTRLPSPITIEQYRGAGAMGTMLATTVIFAILIAQPIYEYYFGRRRSEHTYRFSWSESGHSIITRIQDVTGQSLPEVLNSSLGLYASLVESQSGQAIIQGNIDKAPKPNIRLVIDNSKKPKDTP